MPPTTKIVIGNDSALRNKYGGNVAQIRNAIATWAAADAARGVTSVYVAVDDAATMAQYQSAPAILGDERSHKVAVDAIYKQARPDYTVILGAPDVVPHISLANPTYNPRRPTDDPDQTVPSDLPYACDVPYSQQPSDFVGPTRVLTRLPDIEGGRDPNYLLGLINSASQAIPLTRQQYSSYLGVSAAVWIGSTSLSLTAAFGSAGALQVVPPAVYAWSAAQLNCLAHFFNCHGASNDNHFYGQAGSSYPIAHDSAYISGKLNAGTILAAECCYGAQLFDPNTVAGQLPICNAYLADGAYAVWGSTTIAYGPASTNGQADLICQYFFKEVLSGNSVGVAALNARQTFAASSPTISPADLKTLAQFICLGDASLHCVGDGAASAKKAMTAQFDATLGWSRQARRTSSSEDGNLLAMFKRRAVAEDISRSVEVDNLIRSISARFDLKDPSIASKPVQTPASTKTIGTSESHPDVFHLIYEGSTSSERIPNRRMIEVGETEGRIVMIRELFSR